MNATPDSYQPEKSAAMEHCLETGHRIDLGEAIILTRSMGYMDRLVKKANEIRLHPNNFNSDRGFMLSQACCPLIKVNKAKQRSDGMEPERTEAGLSKPNTEQKREDDRQHEGPG
jgi:Rad3-related DNA helicase